MFVTVRVFSEYDLLLHLIHAGLQSVKYPSKLKSHSESNVRATWRFSLVAS